MYAPSYQAQPTSAIQGLNYEYFWHDARKRAEADVTHEYLSFASSDNDSLHPRMSIGSAYSAESMSEANYPYKINTQYYQPSAQNEVFKPQEMSQVSIPYYRSHSSFPSSNTTCQTDQDYRVPSQSIIMEEYQSPSLPSFVGPQTYTSEQHLLPLGQQYRKQDNYAGQDFSIKPFTSPSPLPPPTQWTGLSTQPYRLPSDGMNLKIEAKQVPINNGIIEDDEDEEYQDGNYYQRQEKYSQVPIIKQEGGIQEQSKAVLVSVPCLPVPTEASQPTTSSLVLKLAKPIKKAPKPKKKYKQSRQKNVFKNFGNAIMNCIQNNFVIRDLIEKRLEANPQQTDAFHEDFLSKFLNNLKNKEDFLQGWRTKEPSDTEQFNTFREIFKEISLIFFNEYAEKYVEESDKLKNKDIHVKAIPLFIKGILNVNELYKFKLS